MLSCFGCSWILNVAFCAKNIMLLLKFLELFLVLLIIVKPSFAHWTPCLRITCRIRKLKRPPSNLNSWPLHTFLLVNNLYLTISDRCVLNVKLGQHCSVQKIWTRLNVQHLSPHGFYVLPVMPRKSNFPFK